MDEEARRHYNSLNNHLDYEREQGPLTVEQVGFTAASYWGSAVTEMNEQCDGALQYACTHVADPAERERVQAQIHKDYARDQHHFERELTNAVREIHRENGLPFKEPTMSEEETVKVRPNAPSHPSGDNVSFEKQQRSNGAPNQNDVRDQANFRGRLTPAEATKRHEEKKAQQQEGGQDEQGEQKEGGPGTLTPRLRPDDKFIAQNTGGGDPDDTPPTTPTPASPKSATPDLPSWANNGPKRSGPRL